MPSRFRNPDHAEFHDRGRTVHRGLGPLAPATRGAPVHPSDDVGANQRSRPRLYRIASRGREAVLARLGTANRSGGPSERSLRNPERLDRRPGEGMRRNALRRRCLRSRSRGERVPPGPSEPGANPARPPPRLGGRCSPASRQPCSPAGGWGSCHRARHTKTPGREAGRFHLGRDHAEAWIRRSAPSMARRGRPDPWRRSRRRAGRTGPWRRRAWPWRPRRRTP